MATRPPANQLTRTETLERRLASLEKAAAYVDESPRTIRRRIADGTLTGYRFGPRKILVDLDEIDAQLRRIPAAGGDAA
jgi:excisionase family DNA binding protein